MMRETPIILRIGVEKLRYETDNRNIKPVHRVHRTSGTSSADPFGCWYAILAEEFSGLGSKYDERAG